MAVRYLHCSAGRAGGRSGPARDRLGSTGPRRLLARLEQTEERETLGRAHLLLAEILLDRQEATTAERHLDEAHRLMGPTVAPPELALITVERARQALLKPDLDQAEALARQAIGETDVTEPRIAGSAYTVLARVALERSQLDEARLLCNSAIDLIRDTIATHHTKAAYQLLSQIEEQAGDLQAALEAARTAAGLATTVEPA